MSLFLSESYEIVQISPGVWYLGLFNGIGPTRTQSKMVQFNIVKKYILHLFLVSFPVNFIIILFVCCLFGVLLILDPRPIISAFSVFGYNCCIFDKSKYKKHNTWIKNHFYFFSIVYL